MFIFARCLRSSAAVTPAKYELDIVKVTTVFMIRKNWENNGTEKIGLVTPTPDPVMTEFTELYKSKTQIMNFGFGEISCNPITSKKMNFNTLRLRHNGCQFLDDIFKCIFLQSKCVNFN